MKRKLSFACTCMLVGLLLVLSACGNGSNNNNGADGNSGQSTASPSGNAGGDNDAAADDSGVSKDGLPIAAQPVTLKGFASKHALQGDWNDMTVFKDFETKSNVHIQWENVGDDVFKEKLNLKFASNDLPDFVSRATLTDAEVSKFAKDGSIIDLTPLIDNYAPNFKKMLDADPTIRKAITSADGKIYSLPSIYQPEIGKAHVLWINKRLLDKMGLPVPKTLDEYYNALLAYKQQNPNGKEAGVALSDFSNDMGRFLLGFSGLFGLGNKGGVFFSDGVDQGPDGKMRFLKTDPAYKEELQFFNKLWTAGLIDPQSFTHSAADWIAKVGSDEVFSYMQSDVSFSKDAAKDMVPVTGITGANGDQGWNSYNPGIRKGNTVITKVNKNPEATMRWFDYWYSEEGTVEQEFGILGQTYKINDDGTYESLIPTDDLGKMSPNYGDGVPLNVTADEFKIHPQKQPGGSTTLQQSLDAIDAFKPYFPTNDVNPFAFTDDETDAMLSFRTDGLAYIKEMETKFITGNESFDNWDKYVKQVQNLGLDDYMNIYNDALDRYNALSN